MHGRTCVGVTGPRLGDEMRVGDLAAHDADHVGMTGREHGLGRGGRPDVALGLDDRVADGGLERRGEGLAQPLLVERRRDDRLEREVRTGAARDVVHEPAFVVPGDDLGELVDARRGLRAGVDADRQTDDEIVAAALTDPPEQLRGEAHPVLERAAPVVLAAVRPRRPELVDDRVVGREHLDPVEAAGLGAAGRRHEPVEELLDLRARHRVAAVGVVVRGQARWRPVRGERVVRVAVLTDVVQLVDHDDVGVRGPAGIGHAPEGRDDRVVIVAEVAPGEDPRPVDGHRLDDDHPGAAERALPVVPDVALAGQAALGHVGGMGPERDPAPQRPMPQPEGFEHVRERLAHGAGSPPSTSGLRAVGRRSRRLGPAVGRCRRTPAPEREHRDDAADRWSSARIIDVDEQRRARRPSPWGSRSRRRWPPRSARTCRRSRARTGRSWPARRRSSSSAACATVSSTPTAWPAGQERAGRGGPGERAEGERRAMTRGWPATARPSRRRRASSSSRGRRAMIAATRSAPGQAMGGDPQPEGDDQQRRRRRARAGRHWS